MGMTDNERAALLALVRAVRGVMVRLWNDGGEIAPVQDLHDALAVAAETFGALADNEA
jgi:hypothetical protein